MVLGPRKLSRARANFAQRCKSRPTAIVKGTIAGYDFAADALDPMWFRKYTVYRTAARRTNLTSARSAIAPSSETTRLARLKLF